MRTLLLPLLLATAAPALAQPAPIKAAHAKIAADYDQAIAEVIELTEIPAPPFKETARGQRMLEKFKALGLSDVHMDAVGNVIGIRPGEKIHEEMISETDSYQTIENAHNYVIVPLLYGLSTAEVMTRYSAHHGAMLVAEGFRYSSGKNTQWLSVDQIRTLIRQHCDPTFSVDA